MYCVLLCNLFAIIKISVVFTELCSCFGTIQVKICDNVISLDLGRLDLSLSHLFSNSALLCAGSR